MECPNYVKSMQKMKARISQKRESGRYIMKGIKDKNAKRDIHKNDSDQEEVKMRKVHLFFNKRSGKAPTRPEPYN